MATATRRSISAPRPGQVALYRFYDREEKLLYVGISNDPRRRWKEHAGDKFWYPQVHHQALTWYDDERTARHAEDAAIRREHPEFNIAGAVRAIPREVITEPEPLAPPLSPPVAVPVPAAARILARLRKRIVPAWVFLACMAPLTLFCLVPSTPTRIATQVGMYGVTFGWPLAAAVTFMDTILGTVTRAARWLGSYVTLPREDVVL